MLELELLEGFNFLIALMLVNPPPKVGDSYFGLEVGFLTARKTHEKSVF